MTKEEPVYRTPIHLIEGIVKHQRPRYKEEPSPRGRELGVHLAFGILKRVLNRNASRSDPQGVVRR